ncbi:adenosylcobinamide-GDP ribazoletransferase [Peptostreptococcus anaerobius]|uniref:Adenosylcobinamide-GDP ribazoletransferase n=1 Tax=Peptostreptococcus anaerobius TaxID=1261 RepID=A0A135YLS6_9FIRM|nr:adenosylcobinamide-GDP ribazoletransferase [Peptostreptococcus anaerobius]KXI10337.1 adenosylcobinamide-GDP ribazoletransferase [Peptostreptococcus anaerobius]MCB6983588.1 adenosylcobinamide-GDP ribazoletransferase [Peptostreptococcus anaerobius]MCQ5151443.1 adenosylcobinamide-GDP ribazoletransferase [Peptostreptococcus anaerobius]
MKIRELLDLERFINILQFLTRISIKKDSKFDPDLGKGIVFFPLVGLVIGLILGLVYYILRLVPAFYNNSLVTGVLLVLVEVVLTGGLHLDGLADTFDGIFSYRSKDQILEIMKDSRMGTNASISLILLIVLKVCMLASFIDKDMVWPIVLMPVLGRFLGLLLTYRTRPARENGMGNVFIGKCDRTSLIVSIVFVGLLEILALGLTGISIFGLNQMISIILVLLSLFITCILAYLIKHGVYKKIGGLTGDILGCGIEVGEMIFIAYIFILVG